MKGPMDTVKLSLLFREIACRKLNMANRRSYLYYVPVEKRKFWYHPVVQPKRNTQQSKQLKELHHQRKLKIKRQEQKNNIPILKVFNGITVGQLAKISQRTPEQIHLVKALAEEVKHKDRKRYRLNVPLHEQLLINIVKHLGYRPIIQAHKDENHEYEDIYAKSVTTDVSKLKYRPPIVAVMGHVDHGKTTILDALRKTSVAAGEAGGITQSIGAFSVPLLETGQTVTFLDTPGHSVFTSMRERGAQVTDIVVLVIAADDGVMEQTIESIKMAKRAETSMIIALNKCDKKDSQPDLVLEELADFGIKCEQLGGEVQAVKISALKNEGLDSLVKCIIAQADQLELKCDPAMQAQGVVIESKIEKGRGSLASVVLKQGTLKIGQVLIGGTSYAKIRQMWNSNGDQCTSVKPGQAANIMGWRSLPIAGQIVLEAESESKAKAAIKQREKELERLQSDEAFSVIERERMQKKQEDRLIKDKYATKVDRITAGYKLMFENNKIDIETPTLNIIVKADVDGSMEAILKILNTYDCGERCKLKLARYGIGELSISEYELAQNIDACIFLFNTDLNSSLKNKIPSESVPVLRHNVIYHLVDDLIDKINDVLPLSEVTEVLGEAEILNLFQSRKKTVLGCRVHRGNLELDQTHRVIRDNEVIHQGGVESMKHFNSSITQAKVGSECGILFNEINASSAPFKVGDIVQCLNIEMKKIKIGWRPPGF